MFTGTTLIAAGVALLLISGLGTGPIDALIFGLAERTGIAIATLVIVVSVGCVLVAWAAGVRPGPGTIISGIIFGPILEWFLSLSPHGVGEPPLLVVGVGEWVAGALVIGLGASLMITADLGVGGIDAVMLAVHRRTGVSIPVAKFVVDVSVGVFALLMGGPIGVGTVALALVIPVLLRVLLPPTARLLHYDLERGGKGSGVVPRPETSATH